MNWSSESIGPRAKVRSGPVDWPHPVTKEASRFFGFLADSCRRHLIPPPGTGQCVSGEGADSPGASRYRFATTESEVFLRSVLAFRWCLLESRNNDQFRHARPSATVILSEPERKELESLVHGPRVQRRYADRATKVGDRLIDGLSQDPDGGPDRSGGVKKGFQLYCVPTSPGFPRVEILPIIDAVGKRVGYVNRTFKLFFPLGLGWAWFSFWKTSTSGAGEGRGSSLRKPIRAIWVVGRWK